MSEILKRLKQSSPQKSEIQADPSGQADQAKNAETTELKKIKPTEPPKVEKRIAKPVKKLDLNEILIKLQGMSPEAFPAYGNLLKQLHGFGKKAIIRELIDFINAEIL
jgi:hypothetical protein